MPLFDLFKKLFKKEPAQVYQQEFVKSPDDALVSSENSPTPVSPTPVPNNQFTEILKSIAQNSIDGTGLRLVLGEGMMPMQETLRNGGRYILVHPGVSKQLEQNNIDPFLVHETAMRMEMTSRIPQIDFAGVDIDRVLQTWSGRPENQVPIHIRQVLWLQRNADQFGYEKMGNSWKLKQ